jgi:hypothetical protein
MKIPGQISVEINRFDAILCDRMPASDTNLPDGFHPWMLDDGWFDTVIYAPLHIRYRSAASIWHLVAQCCSMRVASDEDPQKLWARETFQKFLPRELVNYAYKADNEGVFQDGLARSVADIRTMCHEAYNITKLPEFRADVIDLLLIGSANANDVKVKQIISRTSLAVWLYGLIRDGAIE